MVGTELFKDFLTLCLPHGKSHMILFNYANNNNNHDNNNNYYYYYYYYYNYYYCYYIG